MRRQATGSGNGDAPFPSGMVPGRGGVRRRDGAARRLALLGLALLLMLLATAGGTWLQLADAGGASPRTRPGEARAEVGGAAPTAVAPQPAAQLAGQSPADQLSADQRLADQLPADQRPADRQPADNSGEVRGRLEQASANPPAATPVDREAAAPRQDGKQPGGADGAPEVRDARGANAPPDANGSPDANGAGNGGAAGVSATPSVEGPSRDAAGQAARDKAPAGAAPVLVADASRAEPQARGAAEAQPGRGSTGIRLFNTIEFKGPIKNMPKWQRVMDVERRNPGLVADRALGSRAGSWGKLRGEWSGLSVMDKLRNVNSFFNQWPYRLDSEVWGVPDYWETPAEFIAKSGDCEDYAIVKFYALKQLGISASDMRIVVLLDAIRRLGHAVLVVYTGGDAYVLDNLSNIVLSHARYGHYVPQYSLNEEHRWAHIPLKGGPGTRRMQ